MEKTPEEVKDLIDNSKNKPFILDVREQWEYDICHIKDSVHIPMGKIADNDGDLKIDDTIAVSYTHLTLPTKRIV